MSYYKVEEIYPWLYSIYDPMEVFCYLIVGRQSAVLFDAGYGIDSLDDTVRQICDKPYEVVLSHGHIDHANGAYQFNEAWIHPGDRKLYKRHTGKIFRTSVVKDLAKISCPDGFNPRKYVNAKMDVVTDLPPDKIFKLGEITAEVVPMEGHTAGSIGLLVKEHRVLLCSDAANPHVWMFLNESLSIKTYIETLKRVRKWDFDTFFVGHSNAPHPKSDFDKYIHVAENIDPDKSTPYRAIPRLKGLLYQEDDVAIVYRPDKL